MSWDKELRDSMRRKLQEYVTANDSIAISTGTIKNAISCILSLESTLAQRDATINTLEWNLKDLDERTEKIIEAQKAEIAHKQEVIDSFTLQCGSHLQELIASKAEIERLVRDGLKHGYDLHATIDRLQSALTAPRERLDWKKVEDASFDYSDRNLMVELWNVNEGIGDIESIHDVIWNAWTHYRIIHPPEAQG